MNNIQSRIQLNIYSQEKIINILYQITNKKSLHEVIEIKEISIKSMQQNNLKILKKVSKYNIYDVEIGQGSSGKVFLGSNLETNVLVAVKIFEKQKLQSVNKIIKQQTIKNIQREASIHKQLKNENIVKLYDVFETKSSIYFFLEYCQLNLEQFLSQQTNYLSEQKVRNIFLQILNSFIYLSGVQFNIENDYDASSSKTQIEISLQGLCHRDLKPSNILLLNDQVKLGDFGLCRNLIVSSQTIGIGTPLYMSPLSLQGKESQDLQKNDVWSAGIILYEMLYKQHPWRPVTTNSITMAQLKHNLINDDLVLPDFPKYSLPIKDLLRNVLSIDETKRLAWNQIILHPWIQMDLKLEKFSLDDNQESLNIGDEKNPKILKMNDIRAIQLFYKNLDEEINKFQSDQIEMKMLRVYILEKILEQHIRMMKYYEINVFKNLNWCSANQIQIINKLLLSSQHGISEIENNIEFQIQEITKHLNKDISSEISYSDAEVQHFIKILVQSVRPIGNKSLKYFLEKLQFLQANWVKMNTLTFRDLERFIKKNPSQINS